MKSRQESKLSMYLAVKDYLTTSTAIVTPLPNYPEFSASFVDAIAQIQTHGEQQMFDKSGLKANKEQLRSTLVMLAADSYRKLQAYARYANNQLLLSESRFSVTTLKTATDNVLREYTQGVYDLAQSNLNQLEPYGITQESQAVLLNTINAYVEAIPKPRIGKAERKQSTLLLAGAFATADKALGNIDAVVEIVRLAQTNFYNGYRTVRKLMNTGVIPLAVKGVVTDAVTGEPLKNVVLSFALDGNGRNPRATKSNVVVVKKTAPKGGFYIKSLTAGSYHVTLQKRGYADQVLTVAVSNGEMSELRVQLSGIG